MFIDLRYMLLPDSLMIPGIILGCINAFLYDFPYNFIAGGIFVIIFYSLRVLFKDGLGLGDIELITIISLMLGFYHTLLVVIISSLVGSIYGLYLIKKGRAQLRTKVPFGPFLIGSFILVSLTNIPVFYLPR
ncbi:MAG: prepilin peptidase, partial [bacterium]